MCANHFASALSKVFGSEARTDPFAVLAERRDDWLTAAELCDQAGVSRSNFHRDQKSLLLEFGHVKRYEAECDEWGLPSHTLADSEQALLVTELHYALESKLAATESLLAGVLDGFME